MDSILKQLNDLDLVILQNVDNKFLQNAINFLSKYKEVRWQIDNSNKTYSLNEILSMKSVKYQPLPVYPKELKHTGSFFDTLRIENYLLFKKHRVLQKLLNSYYDLGTMVTPSVIAYFIVIIVIVFVMAFLVEA